MRRALGWCLALLLLGVSPRAGRAASPAAESQEAQPRRAAAAATPLWRPEWPTFRAWEGASTIAAGVGTLVLFSIAPPTEARWTGGILFDDAIRDALRIDDRQTQLRVAKIGDIPYYTAALLPLIIDPLAVAWAGHGDSKAALNLELMGLEAFSYAGLMSFVSTRISRRERPDSRYCREHPPAEGCEPTDTEAFWSGHTSIVAASAGLTCANHVYMPLWGHPVADAAACALATSGAVVTGVTRLMADRHYTTDVIVGLGMGWGIGYAVPVLLHYSHRNSAVELSIRPGSCGPGCLSLSGAF